MLIAYVWDWKRNQTENEQKVLKVQQLSMTTLKILHLSDNKRPEVWITEINWLKYDTHVSTDARRVLV